MSGNCYYHMRNLLACEGGVGSTASRPRTRKLGLRVFTLFRRDFRMRPAAYAQTDAAATPAAPRIRCRLDGRGAAGVASPDFTDQAR